MGTPASPLRKALIDSGLGEDLAGVGLELDTAPDGISRPASRGLRSEDADQVEALILDTLAGLVEHGIEPDMIEAAVNTVEFRAAREQHRALSRAGLLLMLRALRPGCMAAIRSRRWPSRRRWQPIKERLAPEDRAYFEGLIRGIFWTIRTAPP